MKGIMMLKPLPSPRGTNHERLFMLKGRKPAMAYDSRRGLARDADPMEEDTLESLIAWVQENMTAPDIEKLCTRLSSQSSDRDDGLVTAVDRAPWLRRARPIDPKAAAKADADLTKMLGGLEANRVL